MRGLKKNCMGRGEIGTDIATTRPKRPKGRFGEKHGLQGHLVALGRTGGSGKQRQGHLPIGVSHCVQRTGLTNQSPASPLPVLLGRYTDVQVCRPWSRNIFSIMRQTKYVIYFEALIGPSQLATDSGSSGRVFCQVKSGPPSSKTDCLKKRKQALTRSTWGRPLSSLNAPKSHVYHASDA